MRATNTQQNNNINSNKVVVQGASPNLPSPEIKKQPAATAGAVHQPFIPLVIPQAQITLQPAAKTTTTTPKEDTIPRRIFQSDS